MLPLKCISVATLKTSGQSIFILLMTMKIHSRPKKLLGLMFIIALRTCWLNTFPVCLQRDLNM